MPWSMALRMRCMSGSESSSTMSLSSSTSPPETSNSISLPDLAGQLAHHAAPACRRPARAGPSAPRGCRPAARRACAPGARLSAVQLAGQHRVPPSALSRSATAGSEDLISTSSPTTFMSRSSLWMSTRTDWEAERSEGVLALDASGSASGETPRPDRLAAGAGRPARAGGRPRAGRGLGGRRRAAAGGAAAGARARAAQGHRLDRGPRAGLAQHGRGRLARGEEELEGDGLRVARVGRRQRGDHLAVPLEPGVEVGQLLVEASELEGDPHPEERAPPSARWRGAGAPRTR